MVLRQLSKEQAKEEVKKLVDKYNRILESGSIKRYKEEDTKAEFIEPLFEALGWDVRNTDNDDEVVREEKISKGRVDYSFRINGIPKFFLEAKALKEDLDNIKFVEQAVNYSWHKGCTWAVLTDFEAIKIFNAEWKSANPLQAQFGQTLPCQLFLEKFDTLWLLSRESFEKKLLDVEAEKWGKKIKKISVDKLLLDDLTKFRDWLNKNILKNNSSKNVSGDELDEAVQRIIDRLIFIRTLEDKELEAPMLQSVVREDLNKRTYKKLNEIFRKVDDIYNSKLFTPHLCEELDIDDEVLTKIINGLFNTSDNTIHYDFSAIDADVLGNIYEQYLGHILKKTDKRAKLSEGKVHRKEQGIYYTPTYVVDYIVKNTVGELAKDKKFDLKNIKILDPACGSGSFLMKAFDYLITLDKKKNGEIDQTKLDLTGATATYGRKIEILKNNIFGVDLDPKAVEIAQLNLLLKAAEKKHRLPTLQENIKVGNSLIDDSSIAGDRAFKWGEQFKDIMQNGGFDIVIGNPPYGVELPKEIQEHLDSKYDIGSTDTAVLFIKKAYTSLKSKGLFGFIVPKAFCFASNWKKIRDLVWNDIIIIVDCGKAWKEVKLEQVIFIVKKDSKSKEYISSKFIETTITDSSTINKQDSRDFGFLLNGVSRQELNIGQKIKNNSIMLNEVSENQRGAILQKYIAEKGEFEVIGGAQVQKFGVIGIKGRIDKSKIDSNLAYMKDNSLLVQRIVAHIQNPQEHIQITCAIPENKHLILVDTINQITLNNNISRNLIWAILNSKITNWYAYRFIFGKAIRTMQFDNPVTARIPLPKKAIDNQQRLSSLANKLLDLGKKYVQIKDKQTDSKAQLEKEIQKLDNEINEEIYKLYGITEEEEKIIEDSLK